MIISEISPTSMNQKLRFFIFWSKFMIDSLPERIEDCSKRQVVANIKYILQLSCQFEFSVANTEWPDLTQTGIMIYIKRLVKDDLK